MFMKVLHVGPVRSEPGAAGPTQSISGLVTAQANAGLDVGLLSSIPLKKNQFPKELPGVHIICNQVRHHRNPWNISENCVKRIIDEFGIPDLVNFHSTYIPLQTALARSCIKRGWPYIITPRGGLTGVAQSIKRLKKTLANKLFFRSYVRQARAIHALTPSEAEEIKLFDNNKEVFIVPNGITESLFAISRNTVPADLGKFRNNTELMFGFVGRIDVHIKGLDLLLEAFTGLKAEQKESKCKLLIVGPFYTKKDRRSLLSLVDRFGLNDSVKIIGPKLGDEKWAYFLSCDVFVLSSRSEGMPMSSIEAMALGRPCLVTEESRVGDIVSRAGGWVCKAQANSIRQALKQVCADKSSLNERGRRSQQLMREEFTWSCVARRLGLEYARITGLS